MSTPLRKPPWLRTRICSAGQLAAVEKTLQRKGLHTVCEEAICPNRMECFGRGTATFLLLGPNCTRGCTFCAVDKHKPHPVDPAEPEHTAQAVDDMKLDFCVLTMVTRDDLPDHGAAHIARTIELVHKVKPGLGVEVLISDLGGSQKSLETVLAAEPEVLNHNVETVPRLYSKVRPQANYERSVELLDRVGKLRPGMITKSGIMLGLGEEKAEVHQVMADLRKAGVNLLTIGQYLAPSKRHHPVISYPTPDEFTSYEVKGLEMGFAAVASAPLVRSSYKAETMHQKALVARKK